MLESQARASGIPYAHLEQTRLKSHLKSLSKPALIISAANPYLIPAAVLKNEHIRAINCHNALLPRHPGRNAEAWAIFEQDAGSGITWHFITPEVDAGNILIQQSIALDASFTSLSLHNQQHKLAFQSFQQIIPDVLMERIQGMPQDLSRRAELHYSWQIPNNGYLDLAWHADKISAFLRAMDYGILETLGKPRVEFDGGCYYWRCYSIEKMPQSLLQEKVEIRHNNLHIQKDGASVILRDIKNVDQS